MAPWFLRQILSALFILSLVSSQSPERGRLNRFYEVTNGPHWRNNTHWNTTKPVCSWFGVQCADESTTKDTGVIGLFLPSNGLAGRVAKLLYEITSLRNLNLKDNSLTEAGFQGLTKESKMAVMDLSENGLSSIEGIGNAPDSLRELHLGQNRLKGRFPKELTKLHKLRNLFISKNTLREKLPTEIGKMSGLRHFNAYGNSIWGQLPSEIGLLTNLELFVLAENAFTGTIPTTVEQMTSLHTFSLHNHADQKGALTGTLPHFQNIIDMKEVYLDGNALEGTIPHKFLEKASTSNYIHIGLSFNNLTGTIPPELERFSSMQLNLVGNQITHIPKRVCKLGSWMAGAVEQYGCDAILCPNGTYSKDGRQINDEDPCLACRDGTGSPYLGATSCEEGVSPHVAEILYDVYHKLRGSNWKKKDGWEQFDSVTADNLGSLPIAPCYFYGIDCIFNTVHGINLANNGLKGTISSTLFQLPHLMTLDVSRNAVTMTRKGFKALGRQGRLTELNIGHTQTHDLDGISLAGSILILDIGGLNIGGPIPNELFDLESISEIHARYSNFTGTLPTLIGNLADLTRLDLFNSGLSGSVPSELGRLTNVRLVDLAENAFAGELANEMSSMTSLHKLHLHQANGTLTGKLPAFDAFPDLVELLLDSNGFTGSIPSNFLAGVADKTQPISIDLSHNAIVGTVPSELQDFSNLTIRLEGNKISAIAPELCAKGDWMNGDVGKVGSCDAILCPEGTWNAYGRASDRLNTLCQPCSSSSYFGSTFCGDDKNPFPEKAILDHLFKVTGGKHWKSRANWTDGNVGICFREGVTCGDSSDINSGVTEIRLRGNNMGGRLPSSIYDLPSIRVLDFSENKVDIEFAHIGKATKLEVLQMDNTELTSVTGIDNAPSSLTELQLSDSRISGTIPPEILKLPGVKGLFLSNNFLTGTIPSSITSLSSIEAIDFSQNDMTGHLPTEIGLLTKLELLILSENLISGTIMSEFGQLSKLQSLSLALQDKLSGPLFSFSTNPFLTDLDLRHNSIVGPIPSDFLSAVDISQAVTVDLSGNEITGSIPVSLDSFQFLDIDLSGNKIDALSQDLCDEDNAGWMDGSMEELQTCDAILCPPGTSVSNGRGRQVDSDTICLPCPGDVEEAPYFGTTACTLSVLELERETLSSLYRALNGTNWIKQSNWMSEKSVCSWHGVTCGDDGVVVALELQHNNLESSTSDVSDLISSLQNLVTLDLRGNSVPLNFNRIPVESEIQTLKLSSTGLKTLDGISGARKLRKLMVSNNYISDVLPDELFTLTQLEAVYLSFNWLSSTLSTRIGRLSNLAKFYVDGNDFSGTIPSEVGLLTGLEDLVLSDNVFSGSIPSELGSLPKLQFFSADRLSKPGRRLSGKLPAFDNLPVLTTLYLDHNDLMGSIPSKFLSASPLSTFVFLGHNALSGSIPSELNSFPAIYLQLEGNRISGFPDQFCNNSDWMAGAVGRVGCDAFLCSPGSASPIGRANDTLACDPCTSSDAATYYGSTSCDIVSSERKILLRLYQRCGGIEWYRKDGWATDKDICEWFGVSCRGDGSVEAIDLSANNLVNQPPWEIFELPRLESLVLSSNPIDFDFGGLDKARRLTELRLDSIGLSSVEGLDKGVGLTKLNLRFNNLEGTFPQEILALTNLRELNVANNKFASQLPTFSDLTRLRTLRLGSNEFKGPLPSFNEMVVLTTIDLSSNQLSGSIPADFLRRLSLTAKVHVDLASNLLTGGLPLALDHFEDMTIYLRDNRIDHLSSEFCDNKKWNGGDVANFGCNALLCPPGTATSLGRQSIATEASPCARCENRNIEYYGMTSCDSSSAAGLVGASLFGFTTGCVAIVAIFLI